MNTLTGEKLRRAQAIVRLLTVRSGLPRPSIHPEVDLCVGQTKPEEGHMTRIRRYLPRPALVVGIGKLVRVTTTTNVPAATQQEPTSTTTVKASCPGAPIGNLQPVSGGVKLELKHPDFIVLDSHPIARGWSATVSNGTAEAHNAQLILSCARSLAVSGAALPAS
jgi:hypothetical protein